MPEEIERREISMRFRQAQFYVPKFYKDMFDFKDGNYFILKVINCSHTKMKHKRIQKDDVPKTEKANKFQIESSQVFAGPYAKPFKLSGKDGDIHWEEEE